jgi:hypothetical protein
MKQRVSHRIFLLSAANCVQLFGRFRSWITASPRLVRFVAPAILFAVILAPSIWMLSVIPPLWRDVDAYVQLTLPPGFETILRYGPLYSFAARIPLYVGFAVDCLKAGAPVPNASFFVHPILTDSGVLALLVSQHLALGLATLHFIAATTRIFWGRLMLAAAWAANPLFYSFAHTVGSEALSMILLLLLGVTGLKIAQSSRNVSWKDWLALGFILWVCILTRHINAVLAALVPVAFIVLGAYQLIAVASARSEAFSRARWSNVKQSFQKAALGAAVGISCIVLANASVRVLCRSARIPYYSSLGHTFMFRLKFLAALPPEKRNQLLHEVSNQAASSDVKKVVSLLRESFSGEISNWDVNNFNLQARALFFTPQTDPYGDKYAVLLNRTALAFLYPPHKIFLSAIATDFKRSQAVTIPDLVGFLFATTNFYFSHRDAMPQCASLVSFRGKDRDDVIAVFKKHSYFRHPKNVSYRGFLLFWVAVLGLFIIIAKIRQRQPADLGLYASALTVIGLFMVLATCVLTVFQPRFTLPMWELTIISLFILLGRIMESLPSLLRSTLMSHKQFTSALK